ncbi:MAG TPA: hypothetical protein VMG08_16165 [Allosphingosinicella sp.]|nr:hypothetical protein [Allosphingosinicella sp.]
MQSLNHGNKPLTGRILAHEHLFNRVREKDLPDALQFLKSELSRLHDLGVGAVVDVTPYVDPSRFLPALEGSPVAVVGCAGFYLEKWVHTYDRSLTVDQLTELLLKRVTKGRGRARIMPGVLKVASRKEVLTPFEKRAFEAVARVQTRTGMPIVVHSVRGMGQQHDALVAGGADPTRIIFSHAQAGLKGTDSLSRDLQFALLRRVAGNGGFLCFDDFPTQKSKYLSDAIGLICDLVAAGYGDRVILSNDCHWSHRRGCIRIRGRALGPSSRTYEHVLQFVMPMLKAKLGEQVVERFVTDNPKAALEGACRSEQPLLL